MQGYVYHISALIENKVLTALLPVADQDVVRNRDVLPLLVRLHPRHGARRGLDQDPPLFESLAQQDLRG